MTASDPHDDSFTMQASPFPMTMRTSEVIGENMVTVTRRMIDGAWVEIERRETPLAKLWG